MKYYSQSEFDIKYGSEGAAGLDLPFYDHKKHRATARLPKWKRWFKERTLILPFKRYKLPTGIHVEMAPDEYGEIDSRSSTSKKLVLVLCRTIDHDYRGNIHVVFVSLIPWIIKKGDYKFQMVVKPYNKKVPQRQFLLAHLSDTARGHGGFGSTDDKEGK
jgi:deoxyuridine 5'-triphosphate nucleotidohydrolase